MSSDSAWEVGEPPLSRVGLPAAGKDVLHSVTGGGSIGGYAAARIVEPLDGVECQVTDLLRPARRRKPHNASAGFTEFPGGARLMSHGVAGSHDWGPQELLFVAALPGERPGRVTVEVVGEVDQFTVPLLDACLRSQLGRRGIRELIVDMQGVSFLGGAGLSALAAVQAECHGLGAQLMVRCKGARPVWRPLQLTGLYRLLCVGPSGAAVSCRHRPAAVDAGRACTVRSSGHRPPVDDDPVSRPWPRCSRRGR